MTVGGISSAAASRRVRDLLAGPVRVAPVLHRGQHALYLDVDGWCVGLVSRSATGVPCALVLPRAELGTLGESVRAEVGSGLLRLWDTAGERTDVRVGRLVDVTVPRLRATPSSYVVARLRAHASPAVAELRDVLGPWLDAASPGSGPAAAEPANVAHGTDETPTRPTSDIRRSVGATAAQPGSRGLPIAELLGRGSGLTPLGDDVICGWLAAAYALGRAVPELDVDPRARTTLFSATLLECARRGEVLPEFAHLIVCLAGDELAAADQAAASLAGVGHTSGAGLLLGACLRLDQDLDLSPEYVNTPEGAFTA